ncbi:hypothetical protein MMSR116_27855 [Methylobacterium mesophilicum SR1.6/6]|uniref:Uncharacterized protein n=1 Tax=Methylobacterium mesophilicum SR1.6/6 TaxID=908290 RepID=A0A6B9FX14_9HYPH|nr:hypothetical protein [Methylobacterium mesophilicum]QGY05288.1 hypothetical protein MMSR116_27855 [Methylobacterium mesophilicum SR1.6/6]
MSDAVYDLTLERIALIRRMVVAWGGAEPGAPTIHPEAPYGSLDRDGDIANVTGDDEGAEEEHRALEDGLAVFVQNAQLKPGRYQYHNALAKLDPGAVGDVFRDAETGETPEHITFAVTPEHLALIPRLSFGWDAAQGVPRVDPQRPYGGDGSYIAAMKRHLAAVPQAAANDDEDAETRLVRLHRESQPALQIFLRYADLGPGDFRLSGGGWGPA